MNKPTFHKDMPIEEYHAHSDVLSKSMLGEFADCPARYKHKYIDNKPEKKTKSLRLGSAVHTLALEPEKWNFQARPNFTKASTFQYIQNPFYAKLRGGILYGGDSVNG